MGRPSSYTPELSEATCNRLADGNLSYPIEIYGLHDPRDGTIRYIGKAKDSAKRLSGHIRDARRRDTPVYRWIRKLAAMGLKPSMRVIACVQNDHWQDYERLIIVDAKLDGIPLLNVADGGDEPHCPVEVRRNNARMLNSHPLSELIALKRKIRAGLRSGFFSEKARAKIRLAAHKAPHIFGEFMTI